MLCNHSTHIHTHPARVQGSGFRVQGSGTAHTHTPTPRKQPRSAVLPGYQIINQKFYYKEILKMEMREINVMSLMGQLNRGHSAIMSNHSTDNLTDIATDLCEFYSDFDPDAVNDAMYDYCIKHSIDYFNYKYSDKVNFFCESLETCPEDVLNSLVECKPDCDYSLAEQVNSLIDRVNSLV